MLTVSARAPPCASSLAGSAASIAADSCADSAAGNSGKRIHRIRRTEGAGASSGHCFQRLTEAPGGCRGQCCSHGSRTKRCDL